jgi:hypothetical protein
VAVVGRWLGGSGWWLVVAVAVVGSGSGSGWVAVGVVGWQCYSGSGNSVAVCANRAAVRYILNLLSSAFGYQQI